MISDELFERCLRALYLAPPDKPSLDLLLDMATVQVDAFHAALEIAFQAGRESAYDREQWRVVAVNPIAGGRRVINEPPDGDRARALLRVARTFDPDARIEHCRSGSTGWARVPEAGGSGA